MNSEKDQTSGLHGWYLFDKNEWADIYSAALLRNEGKENLPSTRVYGPKGRTPLQNDIKGVAAEMAAQKVLGIKMDFDRHLDGDLGFDGIWKGITVDIKSAPYAHGHLIFNDRSELTAQAIIVVLVDEHLKRARPWCWIMSKEFLKRAEQKDFGYGPRLAMDLKDIRTMNALEGTTL